MCNAGRLARQNSESLHHQANVQVQKASSGLDFRACEDIHLFHSHLLEEMWLLSLSLTSLHHPVCALGAFQTTAFKQSEKKKQTGVMKKKLERIREREK